MKFLFNRKILISLSVILALSLGGYFVFKIMGSNEETGRAGLLKEIEFEKTGVRFIPNGWREFKSEQYGFSILFKDQFTIKQFEDGGGASTFTFENSSSTVGFQLFVVPYGEETISQERFLKDSPLGVRDGVKDTKVDGVVATSFYGKSDALGDTYEIWFIRNGLLYEVSTTRPLEAWLSDIIETWLFL